MKCDACEQTIDFGSVKVFSGRTVCVGCFNVLNGSTCSAKTIIEKCNSCGQSLRIPSTEGTILVTCPKCQQQWYWPSEPISDSTSTSRQTEFSPQRTNAMSKGNNPYATTSFALGLASILLYQIGIVPLLGIVFGAVSLAKFKDATEKNKWMAITGMALSVIYLSMSAAYWANAGMTPSQKLSKQPAPSRPLPQQTRDPDIPIRLKRR